MQITVFIAGLGLIGGSLAASIRRTSDQVRIIGYDIHSENTAGALERGIIDQSTDHLGAGASHADFIFLCAPVSAILNMIKELGEVDLKQEVIVTDVGSTKRSILRQADRFLKGRCTFIGGHPMAGSHKSGITAAKANLFENAYYFLVTSDEQEPKQTKKLQSLLTGTRAKFFTVTPEIHDQITGIISHFPHVIASSLVHHLENHPVPGINLRLLAAGGFRDITRIASSDPDMWTDIIENNRDALLEMLDSWTVEMAELRKLVSNGDHERIHTFFKTAKDFRDGFPKKEKGAIPGYYDLYIDVADQPNTISIITGYIGKAGINLLNLEIIEARENVSGVMRLTFQNVKDRLRAFGILKDKGYDTYLND